MANPFPMPQSTTTLSATPPPPGVAPSVRVLSPTSFTYAYSAIAAGDRLVVLDGTGTQVIRVEAAGAIGTVTGLNPATLYRVAIAPGTTGGPTAYRTILTWRPADHANVAGDYEVHPAWMWKDTAGTDPVTTDGDAVARLDDRSAAGLHLTQATLANRPTARVRRGVWRLEFNQNHQLTNTTGVGGLANGVNLTIGARITPGNSGGAGLQLADLSSSFLVFSTNTSGGGGTYGWFDTGWVSSGVANGADLQSVVWLPNSGRIRKNGAQVASGLAYAPGAKNLNRIWLGSLTNGGEDWLGSVRKFAIFKANFQTDAAALALLEAYLAL